jgi:hypothetical protein
MMYHIVIKCCKRVGLQFTPGHNSRGSQSKFLLVVSVTFYIFYM